MYSYRTMNLKKDAELKQWYNDFFQKRGGPFETSERYNKDMLEFMGVESNKNLRLLDIACGNGQLLNEAQKKVKVFGIDVSTIALQSAKNNVAKAFLVNGSANALPFTDGYFDYVTCLGSLEHFIDMDKALSEMRRVLKPGGKLNIYVPNFDYLGLVLYRLRNKNTPKQLQVNEALLKRKEWERIIGRYFEINKVAGYNDYPRIYDGKYWQCPVHYFKQDRKLKSLFRGIYYNLVNLFSRGNLSWHFCFICRSVK